MSKYEISVRQSAAQVLLNVLDHQRSLRTALKHAAKTLPAEQHPLLKQLCFGTLRTLLMLEWYLAQLLTHPLPKKERLVHRVLLMGLYQLCELRRPQHLLVNATVESLHSLRKSSFKALVNGVLRQFIRLKTPLEAQAALEGPTHLHPGWLFEHLKKAYPEEIGAIIEANNAPPPLWLRVNLQKTTLEAYCARLNARLYRTQAPAAIHLLTPVEITTLPGFNEGMISVQDLSAQRCMQWLEPDSTQRILDACAAPGGKTSHILECAPGAALTAVDIDPVRLADVDAQLQRTGQHATLLCHDAATLPPMGGFDRILIDAPCSGTGVIRRHPDIKWLKKAQDIPKYQTMQQRLLRGLWPHLVPGGRMLYTTCSLLPEENDIQIENFLAHTPEARLTTPKSGLPSSLQHCPTAEGGDGFFYALIEKDPGHQSAGEDADVATHLA